MNVNYIFNLFYLVYGVDYFDILRCFFNGMELLNFFSEVFFINRVDGLIIFENGDVVIMDNCGFNYGYFVESLL